MHKLRYAGLLGLVALVAGCSGEPSESAMRKAVEKAIADQVEQQRQLLGGILGAGAAGLPGQNGPIGISKFEKNGCVSASNEPGYICDFTISISDTGGTQHWKGRFFDTKDGLVFSQR
jgi:hypothetical protein